MFNKTSFGSSTKSNISVDVTSSAGSVGVGAWMQSGVSPSSYRPLSANEITSLTALIAHVARKSGENEFRVERRLADHFNVANVMCLPAIEYDNALRYLINDSNVKTL